MAGIVILSPLRGRWCYLGGSSRPRPPDSRMAHAYNDLPRLIVNGRRNFENDWTQWSRCFEMEQDIFFCPPNTKISDKYYESARGVCAKCPVAAECLADAILEERWEPQQNVFSVRGGLIPRERIWLALRLGVRTSRAELVMSA